MSELPNKRPRLSGQEQNSLQNSSSQSYNTENETMSQIHQLVDLISTRENTMQFLENDSDQLVQLNLQILNGIKPAFLELLNIMNSIASQATQITKMNVGNSIIYRFQQTGLISYIEHLLSTEMKKNEFQRNIYSDFVIQLVHTYSFLSRASFQNNEEQLKGCIKVYKFLFNNLLNKLKKSDNKDDAMKELISHLKAFKSISLSSFNRDDFIIYYKLHLDIICFFHINCPKELECEMHLDLPDSQIARELQHTIYEIIFYYSQDSKKVKKFLKQNNVIEHISSVIISYSSLIQQSQYLDKQSLLVITSSLNLFGVFLNSYETLSEYFPKTQDLGEAVIDLMKYNRKENMIQSNQDLLIDIRYKSSHFMNDIIYLSDNIIIQWLQDDLFIIKALIDAASVCGGIGEENTKVIQDNLLCFSMFLLIIGDEQIQKNLNPNTFQYGIEEIEEEGGMEEINCNLHHADKEEYLMVIDHVISIEKSVLNAYQDPSNN